MIALQISFFNGTPYMWSESSQIGDIRQLRSAVKALGWDIKILKRNTVQRLVWLPARGDSVVPSSPLIEAEPDRRRKLHIKPFPAVVRALDNEEWLELSALACEGNIPGTGVVFGASILWGNDLIRIVADLVTAEAFLPGLVQEGEYWEARWQPVPNEEHESELNDITENMPAVCRCMSDAEAESAPDIPAETVTKFLLARTLDSFIRHSTTSSENTQRQVESVHGAWLNALTDDDPRVKWKNGHDIFEVAKQIQEWRRAVDVTLRSPFKLCFRLTEPSEEDDVSATKQTSAEWSVDYLLQPKADPSLNFHVSDLWKKNSDANRRLRDFGGDPTEFVLTALGQAAGLCSYVADSLKQKRPGGFTINTNGAYTFLREHAEALRRSGFTVMLPSWWLGRGPDRRIGLKAKAKTPAMQSKGNNVGLNSLVEFDYKASLGGEELSREELQELAALKTPLVKVRGQWMQIDTEEMANALRFLEQKGRDAMSAHDLLAVALGSEKEEDGLPLNNVELEGWLEELRQKLSGQQPFEELPVPDEFQGELRHYQTRGYGWLGFLRRWGLCACLADDMGLGKTVQTLALIQKEREKGEERPVLLVVPTTVINNWRKEKERFAPKLNMLIHHGNDRRKKEAFHEKASEHDIVVSSYGLLHRDIDFLKNLDWAGVILDEAHNIKNPETKQSKAARSLAADYRIALTGTPVENHVGDVWALMAFLNPGLLGTQNAFKKNFYRPIQIHHNKDAAAKLKSLTTPFILRREKTDKSIISDLPEKQIMKEYCNLTKEQASLYQAVVDDMKEQLVEKEDMERRGLVLSTLMKLKQVCNHPAQFAADNSEIPGRSGKLQRLTDMLTEIRQEGHRTLVFTQFAEMGGMLQDYLQTYFGEEVFFLYGGLSRKKRDAMISRFQNDEDAPHVFILSLKAGGVGLNLNRADHVVHFDRWWNPAVENQATDRAFRIGQKEDVQVYKYVIAGTLEERIDSLIESKNDVASQVVGSGEQWLTELSDDELDELIKLDKQAVAAE